MKEVIGMLKGIFLIIGAATCWGMGGVAGQYLYQYHQADMIWLCMARQILAGCMFLLFAAFVQKQDIFAILKADTWNIIEFSFLGILYYTILFYGNLQVDCFYVFPINHPTPFFFYGKMEKSFC